MLVQAAVEMTLGQDPELRFTPAGKAVCSMRAVTSKRRKNQQTNEWEDVNVTWYGLNAWERMAENIAESDLKSGMRVIVLGKVYNREWEDGEGNKRYSLEIDVDAIGPSLAFQVASVRKDGKSAAGGGGGSHGGNSGNQGGGSWNQAGPAEDPWAQPAQTDEPPF
jgi:single-strand DNA-binding protein